MIENQTNSYKNSELAAEYFLKLIPDLSVFDVIERINYTDPTLNKDFYIYHEKTTDEEETTINTDWHRCVFMISCDNLDELNELSYNVSEDIVQYEYEINDKIYLVLIDNPGDNSTGISVSFNKSINVIGVCF